MQLAIVIFLFATTVELIASARHVSRSINDDDNDDFAEYSQRRGQHVGRPQLFSHQRPAEPDLSKKSNLQSSCEPRCPETCSVEILTTNETTSSTTSSEPAMMESSLSPTTTGSIGTSSSLWTSVNQADCPTSYPTAQPSFNVIPVSCGVTWLDTVNMWRRVYNRTNLSWSTSLTQVAYGAAFNASGGAKPFKHSNLAYWGSSAEIESPGYVIPTAALHGVTPFGATLIDWLCEVPSDEQLQASGYSGMDLCTTIQKNVDSIVENSGETQHHDILLGSYTQIGCAFVFNTDKPIGPFAGIYVCDFK